MEDMFVSGSVTVQCVARDLIATNICSSISRVFTCASRPNSNAHGRGARKHTTGKEKVTWECTSCAITGVLNQNFRVWGVGAKMIVQKSFTVSGIEGIIWHVMVKAFVMNAVTVIRNIVTVGTLKRAIVLRDVVR